MGVVLQRSAVLKTDLMLTTHFVLATKQLLCRMAMLIHF